MALTTELHAEPIPGYRLVEPLGRGGFGEVWKCEAPGGFFKALKIIPGGQHLGDGADAFEQERRALDHVKTIRHPFLLSLERVELSDGDLLIVMELADKNLRKLLEEYQLAGDPGIPRDELLGYLLEAAEALDIMNVQHHLLHLDIKPDNLFLVCNHVKVADFGLVGRATDGAVSTAGMTPLYAAPERFRGQVAPTSDQYSLAMAYCELLTGTPPFDGKNARRLLMQHTGQPPDLSKLPADDQPVVAKALAKDPAERFASCMDFVQALYTGRIEPARKEGRPEGQAQQTGRRPSSIAAAHELRRAAGRRNGHRHEAEGATPLLTSRGGRRKKSAAAPGPLPGYKFLDRLGHGPCGEYWRVVAPNGGHRLIHLVFGYPTLPPVIEQQAFQRLRELQHPGLMKTEVLRDIPGRFFLLTDVPESTLQDRFKQCQARSRAGVPREELLGLLRMAAETLDELYEDHELLHWGLSPAALVLVDGQVRVADFGLLQLFWAQGGALLGPFNPRYAAPELFREPPRRTSDVYSLALLYAELLTGHHPLHGPANRPTAGARQNFKVNLDRLTEADRAILAHALERRPAARFASCLALIDALQGKPGAGGPAPRAAAVPLTAPASLPKAPPPAPVETKLAVPTLTPVLSELVSAAAGDMRVLERGNYRYQLYPGMRLTYHGGAVMPAELARLKLEGFRHEWDARVEGGNGRDHFVLKVDADATLWQRLRGQELGLVIEIWLRRGPRVKLTEIAAQIQPTGCDAATGTRLLEQAGFALLTSLRSYLQPQPERRSQPRLLLEQPVDVWPARTDRSLGAILTGVSRNVSMEGMRFWLPRQPDGPQVWVAFPQVIKPGIVEALAQVRNLHPTPDGGCDIGVRFVDPMP